MCRHKIWSNGLAFTFKTKMSKVAHEVRVDDELVDRPLRAKNFIFNLTYCGWLYLTNQKVNLRTESTLVRMNHWVESSFNSFKTIKYQDWGKKKYCIWKLLAAILKRPISSHHSSKIYFTKRNLCRINVPLEVFHHVESNPTLAVFVNWLW